MESIWETNCHCGADARVELPAERLQEELTRLGSTTPESPNS